MLELAEADVASCAAMVRDASGKSAKSIFLRGFAEQNDLMPMPRTEKGHSTETSGHDLRNEDQLVSIP